MATHLNSPHQNPSSPPNSSSSSNPNSPSLALPPSSPPHSHTFPSPGDEIAADPVFSAPNEPPQEEELAESEEPLAVLRNHSVYRWGMPWPGRSGEVKPFEESSFPALDSNMPSSSSTDFTDWNTSGSELECKTRSDDYLTQTIDMEPHKPPYVSNFIAENKPSFVGAGLANLGNTCFLNSITQCFIHTVPLLQGLVQMYEQHRAHCEIAGDIEAFCVFCVLCNLVEESLASTGRVISPRKLVDNLSYFSSFFQRFQQEDAHEFLQCFLDRLESRTVVPKSEDTVASENFNFVKKVFGGRLVSKLWCRNCGHCSDTYEPSIDLSLEIEDADNLLSALKSFTKVEEIEDPETRVTCEKCEEKVSVSKQLLLDQAPSVAVLHLKRFKNDGSFVEKIDKYVQFPQELDLLPYTGSTQADNAELKYDLFAVVVHIGFSSSSGHYYCFIRSAPDTWYKFDDAKVVRVREEFVMSQEAYILFYAKQGTPWFSSFVESHKPIVDPAILNTSPKSVLDGVDMYSSSASGCSNYDFDVHETSDAAKEAVTVSLSGPQETEVDGCEAIDDPLLEHAPVATPPCNSTGFASQPAEKEKFASVQQLKDAQRISPSSALKENRSPELGVVARNFSNVTPKTPPRAASPEIYREEPPENVFSIPRGHLKMLDSVPCKRQLNKDPEDMERVEACRVLKKIMPGSRGQQYMAAMRGSFSEGSANKKRRRSEASPKGDDGNSTARRRASVGPGSRILAASGLR